MENFKRLLADRLFDAVQLHFGQAACVLFKVCDEGFFCDYDIPPLTPQSFAQIAGSIKADGIGCAYELHRFSGVYEDGNAENRMLQRIYVTAFETADALSQHQAFVAEAAKHDHKALGSEMRLFSSSGDIGQGLILWHPKGAMIRYLTESFGQKAHILNGYEWVYTPHIGRAELWKTSGHLDFYKDAMYNPMTIDGEEYYLKPMNCPFHINIYNSEIHSYRDLPVKYAEYGTVYRYELSGALNGLTRVRGFTQDDAHIICTPGQVEKEVTDALAFSLYMLRSFGLTKFQAYISTKPKRKFVGSEKDWETATEVLKAAVANAGLAYEIDEGGGAFYGPKIDLKLFDSLNREWQCSTIQFDFNLPERFHMFYVGADGQHHTPYMVHRALFGSLERFMALLIEHYKGDFPFWLAPRQLGIVPVQEAHVPYAKKLSRELTALGLRAGVSSGEGNMRNKIKRFALEKVPYVLVVGDKELAGGTFSVRGRKEGDLGVMDTPLLQKFLIPQIEQGIPQCIFEED